METAPFIKSESLNNFFNYVSVITLPKRKEYITKTLSSMNIRITNLFDAILGINLDKDTLIKQKIITNDCNLKINEIACALSHLSVIRKFYNTSNNSDTLFVFEDDIEYNPDYYNKLSEIMRNVPKDWEYLQFGHCWNNCLTMKKVPDTKYLFISSNPLCGHSYAITKQGAKKILDNTKLIGNYPMDVIIVNLMNDKNLKLYTVYPRLFNQMKSIKKGSVNFNKDVSESTLQNDDTCQECQSDIIKNINYTHIILSVCIIVFTTFLFSKLAILKS